MSTSSGVKGVDALDADGVQTITLEEFATTWGVQRQRFAWLLGAGTSASAGVPLASSIRDRLLFDRYAAVHQLVRQDMDETDPAQLQRVHAYFNDANGMPVLGSADDYSAAFELCLPDAGARKALLEQLISGVSPGFAQRVFGGLVVAGACDLVVTTNFDRLIEKGFAEAQRAGTDMATDLSRELNVAGLDSTARATIALQNRQWPLVLNLHGDFRERRLMNTGNELKEQEAALHRFVVDASRQFGLVVSGYSGRDTSVVEMLREAATAPDGWPHGIWWLRRPSQDLAPAVSSLLRDAAASNVSTTVVIAPSFDETMAALSKQVTVDKDMREYFDRLHPRPRSVPAAIPRSNRKWPVLRFNALPILNASVTATCVAVPSTWRRGDVRKAMHPRDQWPVVVSGPGQVLCLGEPDDALRALQQAAANIGTGEPGPAEGVTLDLLADDAPLHHRTFLLQLLGRAIAKVTPLWMRTTGIGSPEMMVESRRDGDPAHFHEMRAKLKQAYQGPLFGYLDSKYGQTEQGRDRRWAEKVEFSFERRAGQSWLLFQPWTWVSSLPRPEHRIDGPPPQPETDPASPWRNERWAQRRKNETWAAIIAAWTSVLAPSEQTELTIRSIEGDNTVGHIVLSRTNAYSRSA